MTTSTSRNLNYLFIGAKHSRYHARHWFRYLRKFVSMEGKITLSHQDVAFALFSKQLTIFQKITLQRMMTYGTPTYRYVYELNQPSRRFVLNEFFRKLQNNELSVHSTNKNFYSVFAEAVALEFLGKSHGLNWLLQFYISVEDDFLSSMHFIRN